MSVDAAKIAVEKEKVQLQFIKLMADIESGKVKQAIEQERVDAEMAREAIDVALDISKHHREGQNMEVDIVE